MSKEVTFQDITGEPVSGRFDVSDGLITVTLSDRTKTTADIEESMPNPETLAKMLMLKMHRANRPDINSEGLREEGGAPAVCRQNISDIWFGNLREYLAHLV